MRLLSIFGGRAKALYKTKDWVINRCMRKTSLGAGQAHGKFGGSNLIGYKKNHNKTFSAL